MVSDKTRDIEATEDKDEDGEDAEEKEEEDATADVMERAQRNVSDEYIGMIVGALLTVLFLLLAVAIILWLRCRRRSKYTSSSSNHHRIMKCVDLQHRLAVDLACSNSSIPNGGKLTSGNKYNFMATSDVDSDPICCSSSSATAFHNDIEFYRDPPTSAPWGARCRQLPDPPPPPPPPNLVSDSSSSGERRFSFLGGSLSSFNNQRLVSSETYSTWWCQSLA